MGLALALQRLDLIEMLYESSASSPQASSSAAKGPDESLLRYVLNEAVGGASGNEAWTPEFRQSVNHIPYRRLERMS